MTKQPVLRCLQGVALTATLYGSLFTGASLQVQAAFRAACVKVDISPTPPQWMHTFGKRRTTGVNDPLFHRVVVMDDGEQRFALISSDLLGISVSYYQKAARKIEAETGIPPEQTWWSVTHTHASPSVGTWELRGSLKPDRDWGGENTEYSEIVLDRSVNAVARASSELRPGRLGVGIGRSAANINRRARDADGTVFLGKNPDGPVDRQIGLLRLESLDGEPIAFIANYAMHGTVIGAGKNYVSADAPGVVAEYVESKLGAPMLYIQGAAGNIAPIYTKQPDAKQGHLTQFNVLLGDRIIAANDGIQATTSDVRLTFSDVTIETPKRKEFPAFPASMADYYRATSAGAGVIRVPIPFLQTNDDIVIWSAPVELFCEIALAVRAALPFPYSFYFGYTNGSLGYVPTRQAFAEGGYEPDRASPFTPVVEDDFTNKVIGHIESLDRP